MDLTRTLAVTIDPSGAKAGGAQAEAAFKGVGNAARAAEGGMKNAGQEMNNMRKTLNTLSSAAAAFGIALSGVALVSFGKQLFQTEVALQRATNAMRYASGTAVEFARNQDFVRRATDGLGLDLLSTSAALAKLAASARGTSMEGAAIRNLFLATAKGATAMGLSVDETSGALNAFSQMLSKGTVAAEELRGQLGERLYGAFNLAAKSMGMTTQEMNKQLAAGKILATDLMPALTREMDKAFGADAAKNVNGLQQAMNRLNTEWTKSKKAAMDNGGRDMFAGLIEGAGELLTIYQRIEAKRLAIQNGIFGGNGIYAQAEGMRAAAQEMIFGGPKLKASGSGANLALETVVPSAADQAKRIAENQALYGIGVTGRQWNEDALMSNAGDLSSKKFGQFFASSDFSFDKNAIDSAAGGIRAIAAEAETLSKVNSSLDLFFGDMDKHSAEAGKLSEAIQKQREELQKQGDTITESVMGPMEQYNATVANLTKLQAAGAITAETYNRAIAKAKGDMTGNTSTGSFFGDFMSGATGGTGRKNGRKNGVESFTNMFRQAKEAGADTTRALSSGFSNFFDSLIDGTESAGEAFKKMTAGILSDIAKIIMQRTIAEPLAGAVMQGIGSIAGAYFGAPVAHTGGLVGATAFSSKLVDSSVFNNAPRLHSGLKPDEFPAILQRGEEVIPKGGRGGGTVLNMPITVNVDGRKGGSQEDNQKMGAEIARQIEGLVDERIARAVMPRGILSAVRA
jgi:tape measure domain-containing protein